MRFRNSLRLLMENFKQVYKLLLSKLVINLVAIALCSAFVLPELIHIANSTEITALTENVKEFFSVVFTGSAAKLDEVKTALFGEGGTLSQATSFLASISTEIAWTLVGCALVYLLKRYAETVCHFTTGSVLNDKMSAYADTKFFTAFVANFGKATAYSAVYVPLVFLFDVAIVGVVWGILSVFPIFIALFLSMTAVVLLQSVKLTITSPWLSGMVIDDKGIGRAMRKDKSVARQQTWKCFSAYLISVYLVVVVNVVAAITTFGSALILTVPASYFFFICMQFVGYYAVRGKKYFVTFEHIANNPDHGDSEHFFEYLEEREQEESEENNQENMDKE